MSLPLIKLQTGYYPVETPKKRNLYFLATFLQKKYCAQTPRVAPPWGAAY